MVKQTISRKNVILIIRLIHQACLYLIWKEKISRVHTDVARPPGVIIEEIKRTIRFKLDHLAKAQQLREGECSILAFWLTLFLKSACVFF